MSISGLVLHVRPERVEAVRSEIAGYPGVEVHAATEEGQLVVTVDRRDDRQATDIFAKFQDVEGVLSTSLVYNYFEQDSDEQDSDEQNSDEKEKKP